MTDIHQQNLPVFANSGQDPFKLQLPPKPQLFQAADPSFPHSHLLFPRRREDNTRQTSVFWLAESGVPWAVAVWNENCRS
ncbi:MAG: hypothetical protein RLZZ458_1573 [Planctomycetota bacterium]|jgi:hypothetical protein